MILARYDLVFVFLMAMNYTNPSTSSSIQSLAKSMNNLKRDVDSGFGKFFLKKLKTKFKLKLSNGRIKRSETELPNYKNYFNIEKIKIDEPSQYCGEALYYAVEYYCVFVKGTSVYNPDDDFDRISVISKRETYENNGKFYR